MEILSQQNIWLVPFFPFLASIVLGVVLFIFPNSIKSLRQFCFFISTLFLIIAMLVSFYIFYQQIIGSPIQQFFWSWIINKTITLELGYLIDPLTAIMLVLVTTIGVIVMVYSNNYMFYDQGYIRFFCYLSLFTASMLGLVISPNLIQIYIFWELVGMCSYLLIGFWFTRPSAANACQKAFITNRIGDFGLLLGVLGVYWITGSFEFQSLSEKFVKLVSDNKINNNLSILCAIFLFLGPIAKSAQFPLHVWLPDAMEGPTPISALIHAATMVAAGIFLVARMYPFFETLPFAMNFIAWIGAITALLGAIFALTQRDLKKGLAYSTMSQLGYMMLSLGIGSYKAALFHLITHAYSKALLFLGSGSVIHSVEPVLGYHPQKSQNIGFMGGLRKHMPITAITFLFGTLSLCGIPPFACFWSKDEILTDSWLYFPFLGFLAIFTAGLTAFYMFRLYFLTFEGEFRGNFPNEYQFYSLISIWGNPLFGNTALPKLQISNKKDILYPQESKNFMLLSLIILTIPTLFIGFIGAPPIIFKENSFDFLSNWLRLSINSLNNPHSEDLIEFFQNSISSLSIVFLGIFIAFFLYGPQISYTKTASKIDKSKFIMFNYNSVFVSIYNWSYCRGYIDNFYYLTFIKGIRFIAAYLFLIDQWFIDGIVNGVGIITFFGGEIMKYTEGGRISSYLFFLVFCMLFLFFLYSYI